MSVAPTIIPVIKIPVLPVLPVSVPVTPVMPAMVSLVVFPVCFPVTVGMVATLVVLAGMPPGRVFAAVEITAAQANRVSIVGMDD